MIENLLHHELAALTALDAAIASEKQPEYVVLLRESKTGHQSAAVQLATLRRLRARGAKPSAGLEGTLLALQTRFTRLFGEMTTLRAMRATEDRLLGSYAEAVDGADDIGRRAIEAIMARARTRSVVLTAHIARGSDDRTQASRLPFPLERYFASAEPKACMRCLLDRPGARSAIERIQSPHVYVCSACHDETREAFPPDLAALLDRWPTAAYEARIVEKALSKPSRETARRQVHTVLSGQMSPRPSPAVRRGKAMAVLPRQAPPAARGASTENALDGATPSERQYVEELLDPRRLRRRW